MSASLNILPVIDALPVAVLVLSRERGKVVEANETFLAYTGLTKNELLSAQLHKIPLFSRQVRHGLARLFIQALRGEGESRFQFRQVTSDRTLRDVVATASLCSLDEESYVILTFREAPIQEVHVPTEEDMESWKSCLNLAYEPYMEFRPSVPLLPPLETEERMAFLKLAGASLRVRHANNAATELYAGSNGSLVGRPIASFFNDENDAFRFLDMLSVVGQMKAETAVTASGGQILSVEMNCMVRFDRQGTIAAVYCSQRDLTGYRRYEALLGGSRIEMDFTFNQPFVGLAFLTPPRPLERSGAEHAEEKLDALLQEILVMRANEAMFAIHGVDKTRFLMKPMAELFPDAILARRILKELFVVRETSAAVYDPKRKTLEHVSIFRATFDDADRMNGILVVTSRQDNGFQARHSN